jgi:hypothetical protein
MTKATTIAKTKIKRQKGFLYFVDKKGDISCVPMRNSGIKGSVSKVEQVGIRKKPNYMYFVDKSGNVCEVKMSRQGAKKKARLAKPTVKYIVYSQKKNNGISRAKKILLASRGRNFKLAAPGTHSKDYGVVLSYEAKISTQYQPTQKFIKLAGPASKARLVNKVPKKYKQK